MPLLIFILVLLALSGGLQNVGSKNTEPQGEVIVSTVSGGLTRAERESDSTPTRTTRETTPEPEALPKLEPVLDTLAAQNIESDRATLRGNLTFPGQSYRGRAYFLYSRDNSDVQTQSDQANQLLITSSANRDRLLTRNLTGLSDDTVYYYRLCFEEETTVCGDTVSFRTVEDVDNDNDYRLPTISTQPAVDIQSDSATLEGNYRRNDASNTVAFFVYGESESAVREVEDIYEDYQEVEEQDEDLQKKRVEVNIADRGEYSRTVDDLERDTEYFFSLCIAYDDDEAMGIKCGSTRSFDTKSRHRDLPSFRSVSASVTGTSVRFGATLSMEDYLDGHAFLVYGTSESRIEGAEDYDSFDRVRQSGDDIQKISLDADLDGRDTFSNTVNDLLNPTTYYYRYCIEYEGENDRGNDDIMLICDDVDSFQTQ